jgi:hypothetical protein
MPKPEKPEDGPISKEEAVSALQRSGYLLEARVEKLLREREWPVFSNGPVLDPLSGKARELDLVAMDPWKIIGKNGRQIGKALNVLVIECVNNPKPVALLTKNRQYPDEPYDGIKVLGLPVQICGNSKVEEFTFLPKKLSMEEYHYYFKRRVAQQWCTFSRKQATGECMASHTRGGSGGGGEDGEFESFSKLAIAVTHMQNFIHKPDELKKSGEMVLYFVHPMVVLQGDLWEAEVHKDPLVLADSAHLSFEYSTFVGGAEFDCQVDVVTEKGLPDFLDEQKGSFEITCQRLVDLEDSIMSSVMFAAKQASANKEIEARFWSTEEID